MADYQKRTNRSERLDYIQSMLGQLSQMAKAERYDVLVYFIEMAYVEANDILRAQRQSQKGTSSLAHEQRRRPA